MLIYENASMEFVNRYTKKKSGGVEGIEPPFLANDSSLISYQLEETLAEGRPNWGFLQEVGPRSSHPLLIEPRISRDCPFEVLSWFGVFSRFFSRV